MNYCRICILPDTRPGITLDADGVCSACHGHRDKEERIEAAKVLSGPPEPASKPDKQAFLNDLRDALLASKMVSYAQGFEMIDAAAKENEWKLNKGAIALMWRAGCIIRSVFLEHIRDAFDKNPDLVNLLVDQWFADRIQKSQSGWRRVVMAGVEHGIPMPAFSSSLAYYDSYRTDQLPANLLQALRDYFGAHTYERVDKPRGKFFHTNWTGEGGSTTSSSYNA